MFQGLGSRRFHCPSCLGRMIGLPPVHWCVLPPTDNKGIAWALRPWVCCSLVQFNLSLWSFDAPMFPFVLLCFHLSGSFYYAVLTAQWSLCLCHGLSHHTTMPLFFHQLFSHSLHFTFLYHYDKGNICLVKDYLVSRSIRATRTLVAGKVV